MSGIGEKAQIGLKKKEKCGDNMITLDQIRERLQESIRQSGMTQTEIAKKIGVCQQAIGQYLHQNKMPALNTFANLCEVLDVDPAYILCLTN